MVEHLAEILDEGLDTFDIKLIPHRQEDRSSVFNCNSGKGLKNWRPNDGFDEISVSNLLSSFIQLIHWTAASNVRCMFSD